MYFNHSSIKLLIFTGLAFCIQSCYTVRFYNDTDMLREKHDDEISSISSIILSNQIDGPAKIRSICPSGSSLVEIEQTALDGLTHYLSLGFYSPQTIRVWCKRRKR